MSVNNNYIFFQDQNLFTEIHFSRSYRLWISVRNLCVPLSIAFGNCHPLKSIPKEIYTWFRPIYSFSRFLELPFLSSLRRLFRVLPLCLVYILIYGSNYSKSPQNGSNRSSPSGPSPWRHL